MRAATDRALSALVAVVALLGCATGPSCPRGTEARGAPPPRGTSLTCSYTDGSQRSLVSVWWPNGKLRERGEMRGARREGAWTFFYQWGQKKEEGVFQDGERAGTWVRWHRNRNLEYRVEYLAGKRHGSWELFNPDGTPRERGQFADDRRHGRWRFWYPNQKGGLEIIYDRGREVSRRTVPPHS